MSVKGSRAASAREVAALFASATSEEYEELARRYREDPRKQVSRALEAAGRRLEREQAEHDRVLRMYEVQRAIAGGGVAIGVDEVGRGAIADR